MGQELPPIRPLLPGENRDEWYRRERSYLEDIQRRNEAGLQYGIRVLVILVIFLSIFLPATIITIWRKTNVIQPQAEVNSNQTDFP